MSFTVIAFKANSIVGITSGRARFREFPSAIATRIHFAVGAFGRALETLSAIRGAFIATKITRLIDIPFAITAGIHFSGFAFRGAIDAFAAHVACTRIAICAILSNRPLIVCACFVFTGCARVCALGRRINAFGTIRGAAIATELAGSGHIPRAVMTNVGPVTVTFGGAIDTFTAGVACA